MTKTTSVLLGSVFISSFISFLAGGYLLSHDTVTTVAQMRPDSLSDRLDALEREGYDYHVKRWGWVTHSKKITVSASVEKSGRKLSYEGQGDTLTEALLSLDHLMSLPACVQCATDVKAATP